MIGRRDLPVQYREWNRHWGAPYGFNRWWHRAAIRTAPRPIHPWISGPFGFQPGNCETRQFEYPWAYYATPVLPGLCAVELGASLSGLQFVLARAGVRVLNVDPSEAAVMGWPLNPRTFAHLNRAFRTDVELKTCFLEEADLGTHSVDRIFCVSTLEHVPRDGTDRILEEVRRILRPGGFLVLTVDLFLDLMPFTHQVSNVAGHNVNMRDLIDSTQMELVQGDKSELFGFPEFEVGNILSQLPLYIYGRTFPVLAQSAVLRQS